MESLTLTVAGVLTLGVFSSLYRDNPFYRFVEHLLIGVSAGYYASLFINQVVKPNLLGRLWPARFGVGEQILADPNYWLLIPLALGCLMFVRNHPTMGWMSRITVGFVTGVGAGLTIVYAVQQYLLPQLRKAIVPLYISGDPLQSFSNLVLVAGTLACLYFFLFGVEQRGPVARRFAGLGKCLLMVSFGAAFGATVMGRISLLIGRVQFLLRDWLHLTQ